MQAQELGSRPRILFGMDEEGGEPIYAQARGLRMRRLPRYSPSNPFRDCLGTLFRNSLTVGSLKKINNLFIKDIFHGYCLKRQSLRAYPWHFPRNRTYKVAGSSRCLRAWTPWARRLGYGPCRILCAQASRLWRGWCSSVHSGCLFSWPGLTAERLRASFPDPGRSGGARSRSPNEHQGRNRKCRG